VSGSHRSSPSSSSSGSGSLPPSVLLPFPKAPRWTSGDDASLLSAVRSVSGQEDVHDVDGKELDWKEVGRRIHKGKFTPEQCRGRFGKITSPSATKVRGREGRGREGKRILVWGL